MRIVFMGTPDFAVPTLDALAAAGIRWSPPIRSRRGRAGGVGASWPPPPSQRRAATLGVPVRAPVSLRNAAAQAELAAFGAEIGVVAAYGLILPPAVLDACPLGFLNVHGSLLPRWRGAAPIQRAIMAGDAETGVGIMRMEPGLDTGPVLLDGRVLIDGKTAGELTAELAAMGAALMVETLATLDQRIATLQPTDGITYAAKIDKAEARLDWTRSAAELERLVRALNPAPGAWFEVAGERIKLLAADVLPFSFPGGEGTTVDAALTVACGEGALRPTLVQRAGRGVQSAAELLRGFPIASGTRV